MANPLVGGAQAVGQALNSTGGKLLGLGVLASASDDLLKTAKGAISGGGMFGGPGGVPSNALENLTQTELFAGTTSGVRNFFVGILEFFKVIRDLWTGEVSFSDIMSGKISASEALSSAKTREDSPPNALENTYDSVASTVENVIPDFADGGNKHLALAESGALAYMGYRGVKAYRNSGKTSTLSEDSTKKASNMDGKGPNGDKLAIHASSNSADEATRIMQHANDGTGDKLNADARKPRGKFLKVMAVTAGAGSVTLGGAFLSKAFAGEASPDQIGSTDLSGTDLERYAQSEINLRGDFEQSSMLDEALHKGHVLAHGVQDGLAGLVGSPEDLYNMADSWTGGWLPGDHNNNASYNFASSVGDQYLISKPELKDKWDEIVHATGGVATWMIPVGTVVKGLGAGARTVNGVHALETTENIVGTADMSRAGMQYLMP